jgi:uncharacterized protein (DUF1810 family)
MQGMVVRIEISGFENENVEKLTLKKEKSGLLSERNPDFNQEGLERFVTAQNGKRGDNTLYEQALKEIKAGCKTTHWIWYVFPQMAGIKGTHSRPALFYGINGRMEAYQFINHPTLRKRLIEVSEAVLYNTRTVYEIFGNDTMKVRACMLLFSSVSDISVFKQLMRKYRWI